MADLDVQKHSVHTLVFRSLKRTHDMFLSDQSNPPPQDEKSERIKKACIIMDEYGLVKDTVEKQKKNQGALVAVPESNSSWTGDSNGYSGSEIPGLESHEEHRTGNVPDITSDRIAPNKALIQVGDQKMLVPKKAPTMPKPQWHPPWKLSRVISGHIGWVRCAAVEPANEWFATGAGDRMIKIWDLASGKLKLSLTGHISTVRGLVVSPRQPYLFSCGEDKQVKCWDLEQNKVVRHYHGHLSACHAIDIHPTLDILTTCGRDATVRVWDMRTKACIHTLTGHTNTVTDVRCQAMEPQIVSGSHDSTVRLWDLAAGKSKVTLTNHKKSVRSVALHPTQYTMASASPDNIKQWQFPDGNFIQNLTGHNSIVNAIAVNADGVLVSGGDNGSMFLWDWRTGYNFQRMQSAAQPGSNESEAGIFAMTFDHSGSRLITCEADKTIKIYKEDESATEESHPLNWRPDIIRKRKY